MKIFVIYIIMFISLSGFYVFSQETNIVSAGAAVSNAVTNEKKKGKFSHKITFIGYIRMSDLIEQTGNEDTFGVLLDVDLNYIKKYKYADITVDFKGRVYEPISYKSRFYKDLSPPLFSVNDLNIAFVFKYGTVRVGVIKPYINNIPMYSYFPSLFYATTVSGHKSTVLSGPRDLPIGYESQFIPRSDTGIFYELPLFGMFLAVGVANGGEGLDANSSKAILAKLSYSNSLINIGAACMVNELGSIPIKEFNDTLNFFCYFKDPTKNDRFTLGFEGFFFRNGIRSINEYSPGATNTNQHHYNGGYYTDFSIQTINSKTPIYALGGFIFAEVRNLWKFDILAHVGIYDPDVNSEMTDIRKKKYRAFLRITFNVTEDLKIMLSDTFTYDSVFKNNYQYYELENRNEVGVISYNEKNGHYTVDNDLYLGLAYTF